MPEHSKALCFVFLPKSLSSSLYKAKLVAGECITDTSLDGCCSSKVVTQKNSAVQS